MPLSRLEGDDFNHFLGYFTNRAKMFSKTVFSAGDFHYFYYFFASQLTLKDVMSLVNYLKLSDDKTYSRGPIT